MTGDPGDHAPTAERLLDVRTPAELGFAPDGSRVAFALHATVADIGSFVPERSLPGGCRRRRSRADDGWVVERSNAGLGARWRPTGVPVGSHHAGASAAVHDDPGRRPGARGFVPGFRRITCVVERWGTAPGPRRRPRLLRARLERPSRDRRGAGGRSCDRAARRGTAPVVHARRVVRPERGGRPARDGRVGVRLGRRRPLCGDRVDGADRRVRLVPRARGPARPGPAHGPHAVRARRGRSSGSRCRPTDAGPR